MPDAEERLKNRRADVQPHEMMLGQRLLHLCHQVAPVAVALEVVEDDEPALQEVVTEVLRFRFVRDPEPWLGHVDDRVLEDPRIVQVEDVAAVDPDAHVRDVVDDRRQVSIRRRVVVLPAAAAEEPAREPAAGGVVADARKHEVTVVLRRRSSPATAAPELSGRHERQREKRDAAAQRGRPRRRMHALSASSRRRCS